MTLTGIGNAFPRQRISTSEKLKNNYQWAKNMTDFLVMNHTENFRHTADVGDNSDYERKLSNYQLYNNILNQKDFEKECNPFGLNLGSLKDEIKPYNKTYNKINVLLGEELKRPFDYRTALLDQEGIRSKMLNFDLVVQDKLDQIVQDVTATIQEHYSQQQAAPPQAPDPSNAEAMQEAQQMQQEQQQQLQQKIQEVVDRYINPEELEQLQNMSYMDKRELLAYKTLEYLQKSLDLIDIKNDGFKHGLIAGEEIVWVGAHHGETVVRLVNTLGAFWDKDSDTKWIQKGNYAGSRSFMNSPSILDFYGDMMLQEDIDKVEGQLQGVHGIRTDLVGKTMKYPSYDIDYEYNKRMYNQSPIEGQYGTNKFLNTDWEVYHVEWKSQRQIYFQKFINKFGDFQREILSEDFVIPEYAEKITYKNEFGKMKTVWTFDGQEFEKSWIPDIWEATRIGDDIYCNIRRKDVQFRHIDNPFNVSLGYHGVAYSNMNAPNISLMDRMKPFQYLLFIIVHRLKEFIAQDRAPAFEFDITQVDPKLGFEKTLYYLDQLNIHFYNPLNNAEREGAYQRGAAGGAVDRSTMQYINNYIQIMDAIDAQISDVAGVTRQREGQTSAYEAVSNTQQSIVQSTHITEVYFQTHAKLWEHILNSLLHVAQVNWKNSPKLRQYVLDDLSIEILNGEDIDFLNSNIGVFVTNAKKDNQIFEEIKRMAEYALNSGQASIPDIIRMIESGSSPKLKRVMEMIESRNQRMQQQAQEAQQQAIQEDHNRKIEIEQVKLQGQMEIEKLRASVELAKLKQEPDQNYTVDSPKKDTKENTDAEVQMEDKRIRLEEEKLKIERMKAKNKG